MICVYYGTDTEKARAKFQAVRVQLEKKRPGAFVAFFDAENWSEDALLELMGAQTLFAGKSIVLLRGIFGHAPAQAFIRARLPELAASENAFLFWEGKLLADDARALEKHAEKMEEFEAAALKKGAEFPIFSLTDAIGRRDRRGAWVIYQKALGAGFDPNELYWKFVWQAKNMLLAARGAEHLSAEAVGMKPFPFQKAREAAARYTGEELTALHRRLVRLYHEARRGNADLGAGLESLTLEL